MRLGLFFTLLAALAGLSSAAVLHNTTVLVEVDEAGDAVVTETYSFRFINQREPADFLTLAREYGVDVGNWEKYSENIRHHVGFPNAEGSISNSRISARFQEDPSTEFGLGVVELQYNVSRFVEQLHLNPLDVVWQLKESIFQFPVENGRMVVGNREEIIVVAPKRAEFFDVTPSAKIEGTTLSWKIASSNAFTFKYRFNRLPVPSLFFKAQLPSMDNTAKIALMVLLLLFGGAFYYNRETVKRYLRHYIVSHSSVKRPVFDKGPEEVKLE